MTSADKCTWNMSILRPHIFLLLVYIRVYQDYYFNVWLTKEKQCNSIKEEVLTYCLKCTMLASF